MSAADDLTELVERAAAADRAALAAKWKGRADVDAVRRRVTVFAIALSQQPKIRRALMREISDYMSNAEEAARTGATAPDPVGASVREPKQ